jgi:alpha-1,2-mannosyltransferase
VRLKVGVFHPTLNMYGGAEWVAISMINSLKRAGHQTIVLTNKRIDHQKIKKVFGVELQADREVVFPAAPFPPLDFHNIYSDFIRILFLKHKCDVLIDTRTNGICPGVDISYIHYPFFGVLEIIKSRKLNNSYYLPYRLYERKWAQNPDRLIFSNTKFTSAAVKKFLGINSVVLYPPISKVFYSNSTDINTREDVVVSVGRISPEKFFTLIPTIAKFTDKKIHFLIVGLKQDEQELNRILRMIALNHVADRVKVMTDISKEQLLKILRTSKVFLHPVHSEQFGISIVEAMASGCIPIVHNSGGPAEFVPDSYRFNEVKEAAEKIDRAILEWTHRKAQEIVRIAEFFSEDNFSTRFISLFNSYIKNHTKFSS